MIIHFIFSSKLCSVFLQSHPQDTLCTSFQAKWRIQIFRLKFVQKFDLGLEFQKSNLRIRISILKIYIWNLRKLISTSTRYCACMCVCAKLWHTRIFYSFNFFSPNLPKSGSRVGSSENYCRNKNQHPRYIMCANVQSKWTTLNFSVQICPKKDLGFETEKNNVWIIINIVETLCVIIFS